MKTIADLRARCMVTDAGCWEWTGAIGTGGYGNVNLGVYGERSAHRLAWKFVHGPAGDSCVLHRCDNRPCCNPDHLWLGTYLDNVRDAVAKGRHRGADGGGGNAYAALTDEQAAMVMALRGIKPWRDVAAEFGASYRVITDIWRGRTYRSAVGSVAAVAEADKHFQHAHLTKSRAREVMALKGVKRRKDVAAMFGVTKWVVADIWGGKSYLDVLR
jgi:hypothetical protein